MGYARKHKPRDLVKYETVYEDPDYDRLRKVAAPRDDRTTARIFTGGSSLETIGGLTGVVVAVVGFSYLPIPLCAIATIAIGVGLLSEGASSWRAGARR